MNFSDLTRTAAEAWDFIWPPVLELFCLVILIRFLAPNFARIIFGFFRKIPRHSTPSLSKETLEGYGLGKLLPAFIAFLVVFSLYVTHHAVNEVGALLPGEVVYREDILLVNTANPDRLRCLWIAIGGKDSIDQLHNMIVDRLAVADREHSGLLQSEKYWDRAVGKAVLGLNFCKFFIAFTVLIMIVEIGISRRIWLTSFRAMTIVMILLLATFKFFMSELGAIEQKSYTEVHATELLIAETSKETCSSVKSSDASAQSLSPNQESDIEALQKLSWWEWRFYDSHYIKWAKRTLLEHFRKQY